MPLSAFTATIYLGNEAMKDRTDLADALLRLSNEILEEARSGVIRDVNGNTVGYWSIK